MVTEQYNTSPLIRNETQSFLADSLLAVLDLLSLIIIVGLIVGRFGMRGEARR